MAPIGMRPRAAVQIDPLFEFDAPQLFVDLSVVSCPLAHDPWFDQVHPEHSKPSDELARALTETVQHLQNAQEASDEDEGDEQEERDGHGWSPGKENRRPNALDWREIVALRNRQIKESGAGKRKYKSLREARAEQEPFQVAKIKAVIHSVTAASSSKSAGKAKLRARKPLGERSRVIGPTASNNRMATAANPAVNRNASLASRRTKRETTSNPVAPRRAGESGSGVSGANGRKRPPPNASAASNNDLHDLQELLARHNKKFKVAHTYEPRQHSVRDVRQANEEITLWRKQRLEHESESY
ncbi:hypothetical protein BBJ28_00005300 [Nothophytophthora sp. Chile5]|nr:hypothetical protein BBJ28_00005300 [Nothophytophthora sp. Chile5]